MPDRDVFGRRRPERVHRLQHGVVPEPDGEDGLRGVRCRQGPEHGGANDVHDVREGDVCGHSGPEPVPPVLHGHVPGRRGGNDLLGLRVRAVRAQQGAVGVPGLRGRAVLELVPGGPVRALQRRLLPARHRGGRLRLVRGGQVPDGHGDGPVRGLRRGQVPEHGGRDRRLHVLRRGPVPGADGAGGLQPVPDVHQRADLDLWVQQQAGGRGVRRVRRGDLRGRGQDLRLHDLRGGRDLPGRGAGLRVQGLPDVPGGLVPGHDVHRHGQPGVRRVPRRQVQRDRRPDRLPSLQCGDVSGRGERDWVQGLPVLPRGLLVGRELQRDQRRGVRQVRGGHVQPEQPDVGVHPVRRGDVSGGNRRHQVQGVRRVHGEPVPDQRVRRGERRGVRDVHGVPLVAAGGGCQGVRQRDRHRVRQREQLRLVDGAGAGRVRLDQGRSAVPGGQVPAGLRSDDGHQGLQAVPRGVGRAQRGVLRAVRGAGGALLPGPELVRVQGPRRDERERGVRLPRRVRAGERWRGRLRAVRAEPVRAGGRVLGVRGGDVYRRDGDRGVVRGVRVRQVQGGGRAAAGVPGLPAAGMVRPGHESGGLHPVQRNVRHARLAVGPEVPWGCDGGVQRVRGVRGGRGPAGQRDVEGDHDRPRHRGPRAGRGVRLRLPGGFLPHGGREGVRAVHVAWGEHYVPRWVGSEPVHGLR